MPKVLDHIHTYVRWQKKFGEMHHKCADPDCLHTAPWSLIEGKRSLCSICGQNEIILSREDGRRVKPRCLDCSQTKEAKEKRKFKSAVADLFAENLVEHEELEAKNENL